MTPWELMKFVKRKTRETAEYLARQDKRLESLEAEAEKTRNEVRGLTIFHEHQQRLKENQ